MTSETVLSLGCSDFVASLGTADDFRVLWRGFGKSFSHNTTRIGPVVNRRPRNNSELVHRVADRWFLENFGCQYRSSSLFCTGSKVVAKNFGNVYTVVPLNDFHFCWSPKIRDLYAEITLNYIEPEDTASIIDLLNNGAYRNVGLDAAAESNCEIMLSAPGFYVIAE